MKKRLPTIKLTPLRGKLTEEEVLRAWQQVWETRRNENPERELPTKSEFGVTRSYEHRE